jgi:hypothetical protein
MEQKNVYFDVIFSLNKLVQDLKLDSNIDADSEYTKFKEQNLNVYLAKTSDESQNFSGNKIIEHLLVKTIDLILKKSKDTTLYCLDEKDLVCTNRFECKFKLIEISLAIKRKSLNEKHRNDLLIKITNILKNFTTFMEHNSLDAEHALELLILVKRVLKKILPSTGLDPKLIEEFLLRMISFLNRDILYECSSTKPFSNLLIANKYLKCLNLYLDFLEKNAVQSSSLAYGKTHLENFIFSLISSGSLTRIIQEKSSDDLKSSFLNEYYIKIIHLSLRILIHFEIIVKGSELKLSNQFIVNLKEIYFREDIFQLDLVYINQDDDKIIDFNLSCLKYQLDLEKTQLQDDSFIKELFSFDLNLHVLFVKLLVSIMHDYEILVDWLISSETNFLTYLMKYLKVLLNEMSVLKSENINKLFGLVLAEVKFKNFNLLLAEDKKLSNQNEVNLSGKVYLDKTYQLLIEINSKIKKIKRSFPYNCDPLIKLLDKIVDLI